MNSHIAMCGLNCSECSAFTAKTDEDKARVALSWTERQKRQGYKRPALREKDITCFGCLSSGPIYLYCRECLIRKCGVEKGLKNCQECPEYKCERLEEKQKHF